MKDWKVYTDGYYYPHLHIVNSEGKTVAVIPRGIVEHEEENMRKAKVIAAAPKLLEACEAAKPFVEWCTETASQEFNEEAQRALDMIKNAINKAKGGNES